MVSPRLFLHERATHKRKDSTLIKINDTLINEISRRAKSSPRKRLNYNFHKSFNEPVQRFLNALEPATYLRPHKHENPDKTEVFILIKGRVLILEYHDSGEIKDYIVLDHKLGNIGVEIGAQVWHSFIGLEEDSVLYEVKEGPFVESSVKHYPEWAPEEGTEEAKEFNEAILKKVSITDSIPTVDNRTKAPTNEL
ncbi:MAG: WbuC family cupin fold metalloprotein [Pseudomonadota bacterium]